MPVKVNNLTPPGCSSSKQLGVTKTLIYNGSKFKGFQKSKGNSYDVEVALKVSGKFRKSFCYSIFFFIFDFNYLLMKTTPD